MIQEPAHITLAKVIRKPYHITMRLATGTEGRVCQDIAERQAAELDKYGTTTEHNPNALRQWLQNEYEQTLDKAINLRRAIELMDSERDSKQWETSDHAVKFIEDLAKHCQADDKPCDECQAGMTCRGA